MQLYLVRHGIAEDREGGGPDEERALTAEGIEKVREIGVGLANARVRAGAVS